MTLDDVLERGLAAAAEDYDVPADGIDRVREQLAPAAAEPAGGDVRRPSSRRWRPAGHAWLGIAAAFIVLLIAVPIAIGGGGGGARSEGGAGSADMASVPPPAANELAAGDGGNSTSGEKSARLGLPVTTGSATTTGAPQRGVVDPVPVTTSRVEKTGELDLQVSKGQVSATLGRLSDIARLENGYVSDSRTDESGSAPSGEVTLRVPVDRFEQAVHDARSITGTKVLSVQTSGVDVTGKYVDLQARISSLKATRSTFLAILARAKTIGETLSVQQRVTDVQTQIEQLQGQLRVLASTTAMSSLTVSVDQKVTPVSVGKPHHDNGFVKAVKLSVSRFVRGVEAIVAIIGPIVLVLLIAVLGWLAARSGYRATRRHLV